MTQKLTLMQLSTGVEIAVQPVSNLLMVEVQRTMPRPKPPMEKIQNADGTWREEPNPHHPDYEAAISEWMGDLEQAIRRLCIKRGVVLRLNDEQRKEVDELREFMRTEFKQELDSDDRFVYVAYIAVSGETDYQKLVSAIVGRSQPTDPKSDSG